MFVGTSGSEAAQGSARRGNKAQPMLRYSPPSPRHPSSPAARAAVHTSPGGGVVATEVVQTVGRASTSKAERQRTKDVACQSVPPATALPMHTCDMPSSLNCCYEGIRLSAMSLGLLSCSSSSCSSSSCSYSSSSSKPYTLRACIRWQAAAL